MFFFSLLNDVYNAVMQMLIKIMHGSRKFFHGRGGGGGSDDYLRFRNFRVGVFLFAIKGKEKRPGVLLSILPCKI